jgi:YbgC/YbaW family acyl-CoA thioester hydrolase
MAHRTTIAVRFAELDPYRHVNHAVYLTYFEVARTEALASVDLGLDDVAVAGYQFVVIELQVKFRRAAVAGDVLTVDTEISEIGRASTRWSQNILRPTTNDPQDGELMVSTDLKVGVTDRRGKPTRPPAWMFERAAALLAPGD